VVAEGRARDAGEGGVIPIDTKLGGPDGTVYVWDADERVYRTLAEHFELAPPPDPRRVAHPSGRHYRVGDDFHAHPHPGLRGVIVAIHPDRWVLRTPVGLATLTDEDIGLALSEKVLPD
jgi:hypothetical protein